MKSKDPQPMPEELMSELYGLRLLVFIETGPQSNQYNQILLDKETFKRVSFAITPQIEGPEDTIVTTSFPVPCSKEVYTLPDLQQIHDTPELPVKRLRRT
jgi:hypothetical protein